MSLPVRIFIAILALGAYAQVMQAVLIREALVVFYGNEVSLGTFYASWLFWLGVGALAVLRLRDRPAMQNPLPWVRGLTLALPLLLVLQVIALRTVRLVLDVSSSEFVPLGDLFLALFLVTLPSGLAMGLTFPMACRALELAERGSVRAVGLVSRLYIADALGALAGGVLFTLVLVRWLGIVQTLGVLTALLGATAWSVSARPARPGPWAPALLAAGLVLALPPLATGLDARLEALRFGTLQPGLTLLNTAETRYGHLSIARLGDQFSVVEDGQVRESFPLPHEVAADAAYLYAQADGPERVLVLGGFAGGLPAELLRYPIQRLDQVEQDRAASDLVRPYLPESSRRALEDPRLELSFTDGRRYLRSLPPDTRYGLVVVFAQSPTNAAGNRYFTRELYRQVRDLMTEDGVLCTRVSAASNYLGSEVGGYAGSLFHTLGGIFDRVTLMPGDEVTLCASGASGPVTEDPAVLQQRYLDAQLDERTFPPEGFRSLLPADDIAYLRNRLADAPVEINTDTRPVTYYLNTVLWGKLSASGLVDWMQRLRALGPWPYLLPALVFVGLWFLRASLEGFRRAALQRQGGGLALFTLGLVAMAAQLVLLFGYQSHVGFVFERVALLNGVFMTGLALGAGAGGALAARGRPLRWLVAVLALVATGALLLSPTLGALAGIGAPAQELGYLGLALAVGLVTGTGFPLGVALAHRDLASTPGSAGLAQAADNLGGALGGLIAGALMIPLLGVEATCRVLSALALLAAAPLLFARWAPELIPGLNERGFRSLPWPGLGWTLMFLVLVSVGWHWLQRGAAPGPQLQFDAERLTAVTQSARFQPAESPFPHFLGFGSTATAVGEPAPPALDTEKAETAAVASMAAAPEVRGFAGPLNLLVGIDRQGTLRGVQHVASDETPSYIAGIDAWLAGLAGTDLSEGPFDLGQVDALSGATVSSRAALESINRAAAAVTQAAFGKATPALPEDPGRPHFDLGFWATLALLLAFFPVFLTGSEPARLGLQVAAVGVLGFWLNTPITEVDLVNLLQGHAATPAENPQRWLLLGFIAITALAFGQVWCGYLCPFGALQELVSRLGRGLGLRAYPDRRAEGVLRTLKFVLLAGVLLAVLGTGDGEWASFDPMQHLFGGRIGGWMLLLAVLVLAACLVYVRFWCRYLCPIGAFLALSNKLALIQRLAPARRFEHCDLGVKGEFDVDCIRCSRCLTGRDTRLRHGHNLGRPNAPGESSEAD